MELMESEEMNLFVENNQELIGETTQMVENFKEVMAGFVYNNPTVFVEANLEDMYKNIRIFSEVAIEQYLHEVVADNASRAVVVEPLTPENALNDYL
jgi:hypothetical protein